MQCHDCVNHHDDGQCHENFYCDLPLTLMGKATTVSIVMTLFFYFFDQGTIMTPTILLHSLLAPFSCKWLLFSSFSVISPIKQ